MGDCFAPLAMTTSKAPFFMPVGGGEVKDEKKFSWPTLFFSKECIFI